MGDHLNLDINPETKSIDVNKSANIGALDFLSDKSDKSDNSPVLKPISASPKLSVVDTMGTELLTNNKVNDDKEVNMFESKDNGLNNGFNNESKPNNVAQEDTFMLNQTDKNDEFKPLHRMSPTEIKNEKIDYIYKFKKLGEQGIRSTMNYNMNSPLDEMRNEYLKLKRQREIDNGV